MPANSQNIRRAIMEPLKLTAAALRISEKLDKGYKHGTTTNNYKFSLSLVLLVIQVIYYLVKLYLIWRNPEKPQKPGAVMRWLLRRSLRRKVQDCLNDYSYREDAEGGITYGEEDIDVIYLTNLVIEEISAMDNETAVFVYKSDEESLYKLMTEKFEKTGVA